MIAATRAREGLGARANNPAFARYEYVPTDGDWSKCVLRLDDERKPDWIDDDVAAAVLADCKRWVKSITIDADTPAVLGGKWIIRGKVKIDAVDNCTLLIDKGAELTITSDILGVILFGDVRGSVQTGAVCGTGSVQTGDVRDTGSVQTGDVRGTGSVQTGAVCDTGSVQTGDVAKTTP